MDKKLKRTILIVTVIISLAIVFVPIYFFVLADENDDNKFEITSSKIIGIEDGTAGWDNNDTDAGNDTSSDNGRVRTFDKIVYTIEYTLGVKQNETTSGNVEGRNLLVEVLIPTTYEAVLKYDEIATIQMNDSQQPKTIDGVNYYYGSFNVPVSGLGTASTFNFSLDKINTSDINTYNSIKPLVFIKESTDTNAPTISEATTLPSDITCEIPIITGTDPDTGEVTTGTSNVCDVTITGKEDYFIKLYSGSKKADTKKVPVGILLGLMPQEGKGIKGLIIPKTISFTITNSDPTKLTIDETPFAPYTLYQSTADYKIELHGTDVEMPEIGNGDIDKSIADNVVTITIDNIKDYKVTPYSDQFYYFSTNYFVTTIVDRSDYSDMSVNLTATYLNGRTDVKTISDTYNYVLGKYSSYIDIYESRFDTSNDSSTALPYGKANINYGGDFTFRTTFAYSSLDDSTGDGLTSLTNYIKIDNDAFKLIEVSSGTSTAGYDFKAKEQTSLSSLALKVDGSNPHVLFGFGEWNDQYFEATSAEGCPNIDFSNKDQLMNLYGGPCLRAKDTVQWAYSPSASNDVGEHPIDNSKRVLIVESTYVAANGQYINPGSEGTLELYGTILNDTALVNTSHQIVTCASVEGKDENDLRYLGNESVSGNTLLTNPNNFVKTNYDYANRNVTTLNSNICNVQQCPVTGNTILISGIKVTNPTISSHRPSDESVVSNFYYYPIALKFNANATKGAGLTFNTIYLDVYLPDYMIIDDNYGDTPRHPTVEDTTLSSIRTRFNQEAPEADVNYKVYHYVLTDDENSVLTEAERSNLRIGSLSNFVIYSNIDLISTPNASHPEIYAVVDFKSVNNQTGGVYYPITPEIDRYSSLNNITLYNESPVVTKATVTPSYIEKGGNYTVNMFAYNHSSASAENGYTYPTADLVYVLPYNGDLASADTSSKIGSTTYNANFIFNSDDNVNLSDYKFYYRTKGTSVNIISDEIKGDVSTDWKEWTDPTTIVEGVIAIKIVKQSPFAQGTYFGSYKGFTVNIQAVGSTDGNTFYNLFHILAGKPEDYSCSDNNNGETCNASSRDKINYISSASKVSVYERIISGFVFEDYDYNGIYTDNETKLKGIPVSLYKIDSLPEDYDPTIPSTFVKETDVQEAVTTTGENGNYYFGGLSSGIYYVSYTIDNKKYIITDIDKIDETIPNSANNNSSASILTNTNRAVSKPIVFPEDNTIGNLTSNTNLGLAIKKEMAIELNKYITEVTVTKDGRTDTYDYSDQNATQVSISVLNPTDTKVQVKYSFSVENTKYFPGYIGLIVDNMPTDMTFNPNIRENQYWVMYDNLLYYNGLSGKLLLPNEKQYFSLVLDLDLKQAGTYRNVVSARDITLMGEELPVYDFSVPEETSTDDTEGGE